MLASNPHLDPVMEQCFESTAKAAQERYDPQFLKFLKEFETVFRHERLFPKDCRTCGRTFRTLAEYLLNTVPKGHSFEDCEETMRQPYTMTYRHCSCGNTLVLTLTEETYPYLRELWSMLHEKASRSGRPINEVVREFSDQWQHYIITHNRNEG